MLLFISQIFAAFRQGNIWDTAGMQQVIASDHQESLVGKTHRDARDEEVELHSVLAILSSRKRETRRDEARAGHVDSETSCVSVILQCRQGSA